MTTLTKRLSLIAGIGLCLLPQTSQAESDILGEQWQPAVCFSAYRDDDNPQKQLYPEQEEIAADLQQVQPIWKLIRLYDSGPYAERTLAAIREHKMPVKMLLGAELRAEFANPANSWTDWSTVDLEGNRQHNEEEVERLIALANKYPDIIVAVAVGNETMVDWTANAVQPERVAELVLKVKDAVEQPVTSCDNWVPWTQERVDVVAEAVDFISLHTYPQWEGKSIDQALPFSKMNYYAVKARHPGKKVIITEGGWCTTTNSDLMVQADATDENQKRYVKEMMDWTERDQITYFLFEAYDELWKGSDHMEEPEKHWGVFNRDRSPKLAGEWLLEAYGKTGSCKAPACCKAEKAE